MTKEHLRDLLGAYSLYLVQRGYTPARKPDDRQFPSLFPDVVAPNIPLVLGHALWMCTEALKYIAQGDVEKAMRWLCFVQGCLWMCHIFTIEQMREHSRPPEKGGRLPVS